LANLKIIVEENLPERAARLAPKMMAGLEKLRDHPLVGDVRGLGLMAAVELVSDKATKGGFEPSLKIADRLMAEFRNRGLYTRVRGEVICLAPPLTIPEDQLDRAVEIVGEAIDAVARAIK
jgi:adenosylmethionine-8-amino-7-oxononanoate aminotransferase